MNKIKSIWILVLFSFCISAVIVLGGDDFFWATSPGMNHLKNGFEGYNGRYVGNLIVIIMTKSFFARLCIYTPMFVGIILLIFKLLDERVKIEYIILLVLLMPVNIFRQTFGWIAGFSNYVVSSFFVLLIFYILIYRSSKISSIWIIFILSFISQFFVENVSLINVVISSIFLILSFFINKEKVPLLFSWTLGSILGLWVMFQNSAYTNDSSRSLSHIHSSEMIKHLLQDWSELIIKQNFFLIILFSIALYLILDKPKFIGFFLLFFNVYLIGTNYLNITFNQLPLYVLVGEFFLILVFFGLLIFSGIKKLSKKDRFLYMAFLIGAIMYVSPFIIVTPFGPRNVLLTYFMLIIPLGILYTNITIPISISESFDKITKDLIICLSLFIFSLYSINKFEDTRRLNIIYEAVQNNEDSVNVRSLPFPILGHHLDTIGQHWRTDHFKEYYKINNDFEIQVSERKKPLSWNHTNN